jgi:hypothetical protein
MNCKRVHMRAQRCRRLESNGKGRQQQVRASDMQSLINKTYLRCVFIFPVLLPAGKKP